MRTHGFDIYGEAPPEYGIDAQTIRTIRYDLSNGRTNAKEEIGGNVLWVMKASNPYAYIDVHFNDLTRDTVRMREGMQLKGVQFSRIYVTHPAQPGEELFLCYTIDKFKDLSIIPPALNNSPTVYDKSPWRETELQRSFMGGAYRSQTANQYSHVQLWNPADSNIIGIITSYSFCSSSAGTYSFGFYNAALTGLAANSYSKHSLGGNPILELRTENNVAQLVTHEMADQFYWPTNDKNPLLRSHKIILTPGWGFNVFSALVDKKTGIEFEWLEYAEPLVGLG